MNDREQMPKDMTPSLPLWSYQLQRDSRLAVRTRKDLEAQLIAKSFKDEAFKQELLANPKSVVEKELGAKSLEDIEIKVFEETVDTLYIVLPKNPYEELDEPDLKAYIGVTLEDVAHWALEQQRNVLLEETSSVGLIIRAWKDKAFKQELLANPRTVIEKEFEISIPEGIEIKALEETTHTLYIVLPRNLAQFEDALGISEKEFEVSALGGVILVGASNIYTIPGGGIDPKSTASYTPNAATCTSGRGLCLGCFPF